MPAKLYRRFQVSYRINGEMYYDATLDARDIRALVEADYLLPQIPRESRYVTIEWEYTPAQNYWTATAYGWESLGTINSTANILEVDDELVEAKEI